MQDTSINYFLFNFYSSFFLPKAIAGMLIFYQNQGILSSIWILMYVAVFCLMIYICHSLKKFKIIYFKVKKKTYLFNII